MNVTVSRRNFLKGVGATTLALSAPKIVGADSNWIVTGTNVSELASFDNQMQIFMQARNISGGALAVTQNGRLVLARGYSFNPNSTDLIVQPDSLFRIASISKPITAVAIFKLVEDGVLSLNSRLVDILTLIPPSGQASDPRMNDITVRRLLQHLGGWNRNISFDPMFYDFAIANSLGRSLSISKYDISHYMTGRQLNNNPGTIYAYSNYGYSLLGQIIEAVSGMSYESYINNVIWNPLGRCHPILGRTLLSNRLLNEVKYHSQYSGTSVMDGSGAFLPSPYGAWNLENMDSHGGWLSSVVDLARFAVAFDFPSVSPLLNASSINTMFGLPEVLPGGYTPGDFYYANGWAVRDWGNGVRNTWHDGSLPGTTSLLVRRNDGVNWSVMFNQRDDPSNLSYFDIDGMLHNAANAVSVWPTHDLFATTSCSPTSVNVKTFDTSNRKENHVSPLATVGTLSIATLIALLENHRKDKEQLM